MPLGYKYVERSADSQINWAEVGRESSGMLLEFNRVREEKKAAYDQADRESINNLMNAPQGENQDANGFINNFAHDMIQQKKINQDLFKRGLLKEREYTLMNQNQMDGTKQLFEVQKLYQQKYKEKMDGVNSGELQAMNIFNMSMVEGYGDFNNSKATVNPVDGTVGIGLLENKIVDGKSVRVLSKNIAPVNVIRGKILHDIPTFDVDKATTNTVANFGSRKDILYDAASYAGAGTITELMGPDFLATLEDPVDKKIVSDIDTAVTDQVGSFFAASPYNLSSVLTQNLGKYNSQSFTFDKNEADKDPNKILVKVDPNTQMTTLDNTGKYYKDQYKEASEWVKRDIYRKMDEERSIKVTPQNELQESAAAKARAAARYAPKTKDETPPPVSGGEILNLTQKNAKGEKVVVGVNQRLENLLINEVKGVQNFAESISYNHKNNTLELGIYQTSGKESEGGTAGEAGTSVSEGTSGVKKIRFIKNDAKSAGFISIAVTKIPNPDRPGYNFQNIDEAKNYYKRMYQERAKSGGSSSVGVSYKNK